MRRKQNGRVPAERVGVVVWCCFALAVLAACDAKQRAAVSRDTKEPPPRLGVEFAGCAVVHAGPRCELTRVARTLTLWVPGVTPIRALGDGRDLALGSGQPLQGGVRYRVELPIGVERLTVLAKQDGARFELVMTDAPSSPLLDRALELRGRGDAEGARALLEQAGSTLPVEQRERADALLARLARSRGDYTGAADGLQRSMRAAFARGRISDGVLDATALSYVLCMNLHRYDAARAALQEAAQASAEDPGSRALLPQYEGTIALATGDLRTALRHFRETAARAQRLLLVQHELLARQKETTVLSLLGRGEEALDAQQRIVDDFPKGDPCRAVDVRDQLIWLAILMRLPPGDPRSRLIWAASDEADQQLSQCDEPWRRRNHLINQGLLSLQAEQPERAQRALDALGQISRGQDTQLRAWELELRGRLALARHQSASALQTFRSELQLSKLSGLWDNQYLASFGVGLSLELARREPAAIEAYLEADQLMDALVSGVPLGEGARGFLHARDAALARLLRLLVRRGESARALELARKGRSRAISLLSHATRIAQLDDATRARWEAALAHYYEGRETVETARDRAWQLPADQLAAAAEVTAAHERAALAALDAAYALLPGSAPAAAPERPGVTLLAFAPAPVGFLGFCARDGTVLARQLPPLVAAATPAQLAAGLIAPFAQCLRAAHALRVLLPGDLATVDVHALALDGRPLLARYPVAYALDVGSSAAHDTALGRALVVADAASDLPAASQEGALVRAALGPSTTELLTGGASTRARVLASLPNASLFHYAGHGQYAGVEGIESALRLADGWLTFGDILALPSVPRFVVLSACEGAGGAAQGFAGGAGVAEAFIARGGSAVIASVRPVGDRAAQALFRALYAARSAAPDEDAPSWLRRAQLTLVAERPAVDWASFRAIVP